MSSLDFDPAYNAIVRGYRGDTVQGYADNDAKDTFMGSRTAQRLAENGQDPDIAYMVDSFVTPPGPAITDETVLQAEPWDGKSKPTPEQVLSDAGKTLLEYFKKTGAYAPKPRDYDAENRKASATLERVQAAANPNLAQQRQQVSEFKDAEAGEPTKKPELTHTDYAKFALDSSGWLNLGFTNLGLNYLRLNDAPEDVRHAIGAIYHITNSPDWYRDNPLGMNWPGTMRLGKEIITDPVSFFSLGQLRGVLGMGAAIAQKAGIKNPWLQKMSAGLFGKAILSGEGGSLAAMQEIMVQKMQGRKEIDYERVRNAGLYGFAFTAGLTAAAPLALKGGKKLMGVADRMAADGTTMRMFLGEGSLSADKKALAKAKQMHKAGETKDDIWESTGWMFDPGDGKWRYEISDADAVVNIPQADLRVLNSYGIDVHTDLRTVETPEVDKLMGQKNYGRGRFFGDDPDVLNLAEIKEKYADNPDLVKAAENVDAVMGGRVDAEGQGVRTLGDVMDHPALFEAYPWLRDHRVDIDTQMSGAKVEQGEMTLGMPAQGDTLRKAALHEAQHLIQAYEKFARGGSVEMFKRSPDEIEEIKNVMLFAHSSRAWLDWSAENAGTPPGPRWREFKEDYLRTNGVEPAKEARGAKLEHYDALGGMVDTLHNKLRQSRHPEMSYYLLAGEVEARNVETRADMTAAEQYRKPPWMTEKESFGPDVPDEILAAKIYTSGPDVEMSQPIKGKPVQHTVQTEADNPSSIVNMLYNAAGDPPPSPTGKKWTKADLAKHLDQQAEQSGRKITEFDDAAADTISDTIANETVAALGRKGNSSGWYNEDIKETIKTVNQVHPEIKRGNVNEGMFMLGMSITSNGKIVDYNFNAAEHLYQHFKNTGRFPDDAKSLEAAVGGFGQELPTLVGSMRKANAAIDRWGVDKFVKFLNTEFTVRELEAAGFPVSSEGKDYLTHGSVIFGPKIGGGFYQNLIGNFNPITFDRWWTYSWGRWTGNSIKTYSERGLRDQLETFRARFAEDLQASGLDEKAFKRKMPKTERGLLPRAQEIYKTYKKNNFQPRTKLNQAAQRFVEARTPQMELEPGSSGNRNYMRKTARIAIEKLNKLGYNVTPADLQATVWYPEKELHRYFGIGTSKSDPDSYSLAAKRFLKEYRKGAKGGRRK